MAGERLCVGPELVVPSGRRLQIEAIRFPPCDTTKPSVMVVAGLHGNEMSAAYAACRLAGSLSRLDESQLHGGVLVLPVANPLGTNAGKRYWPLAAASVDLNRIFPGSDAGDAAERVAHSIAECALACDVIVDIHSTSGHFSSVPHVRVFEDGAKQPLAGESASMMHDVVGAFPLCAAFHLEHNGHAKGTLAEVVQKEGKAVLVVEGGDAGSFDPKYADLVHLACLEFLVNLGVVADVDTSLERTPIHFRESQRHWVTAQRAGLFLREPQATLGSYISAGDSVGAVVDPFTGELLEEHTMPHDGYLLATRRQPFTIAPGGALFQYGNLDDVRGDPSTPSTSRPQNPEDAS